MPLRRAAPPVQSARARRAASLAKPSHVKSTLLCLCSVALPALLGAQSTPDRMQSGNGARARAMGDAMTAAVSDATALGWNPAGLTLIQRPEIAYVGALRLVQPDPRFDGPLFAYSAVQVSPVTVPVSFASLAVPVQLGRMAVVGALAYRAMHDWSFREDVRSYFEDGDVLASLREVSTREGGVYAVSTGLGVSFAERLRIGATANFMMGKTENTYNRRLLGTPPITPSNTTTNSQTRGYSGTSIDLGAIVHLGQRWRVGTRVGLPFERESEFVSATTNVRSRLEAPMTYAFGVMFNPKAGSVWSFDVRHEPWTEARTVNLATSASAPSADFDITSFHFGYEGNEDFRGTRVSTRAGLFYRPSAYGDVDDKQVKAIGGSLGRGWRWGRVGLDLTGSYVFWGQQVRNVSSLGRFEIAEQEIQVLAGMQVFLR